jgi:prolyl 4-hydroxylase
VVSLRPLVLTVPMAAPPSSATIETKERDRLRRLGRKVRTRLQANSSVRRIEVENAELWAVPRFLDGVACGRLMTIIDGVAQPSTLHDVDYGRVRSSYSGDIDPGDPFIGALQQRIDDLLGIDPANGETIQGQRYLPGQEFLPHTDWFWPGSPAWANEWPNGGQRAFTAMAFLNDVEAGGETEFTELGIAVTPRAGTLLVWNNADADGVPNEWTIHAGRPVVRGVKYIITKWYRTRPWR